MRGRGRIALAAALGCLASGIAASHGLADPTSGEPPMTAELTLSPSSVVVGNGVYAYLRVDNAKAPIDSWRLTWGDGSGPAEGNGNVPSEQLHSYSTLGSYQLRFTVHAGAESAEDVANLVVRRLGTYLYAEPMLNRPGQLAAVLQTATQYGTGGYPLPGRMLEFSANGSVVCSAVTGDDGVAVCEDADAWASAVAGRAYTVRFAGDETYDHQSATRKLLPFDV